MVSAGLCNDFLDTHRLDALGEAAAEDRVAVVHQEPECGFVGKGRDDLLGRPPGGRRGRDVEVQHAAAIVRHDHQHIEHAERHRRDEERSRSP